MKKLPLLLLLTTFSPLSMTGCQEASPPSTGDTTTDGDINGRIISTLKAYDALQKALASDDFDAAQKIAVRVESSATAAKQGAPGKTGFHLNNISKAAVGIKSADTQVGMRRFFGEMSKSVMTMISERSSMQEGRYAFKCPMAKGYQKWVQTTPTLQNPYFGEEMLTCGTSTSWQP